MSRLIVLVSLLIAGCGRAGSWPVELNEYVERYAAMSRDYGVYNDRVEHVLIEFTDRTMLGSESVVGLCETEPNRIRIKRSAWDQYDWARRQVLVFHELGHCVHAFQHRDSLDPATGWPTSIMYHYLLSADQYAARYDQYNRELFTGQIDNR